MMTTDKTRKHINWSTAGLGEEPDGVIARRLGVDQSTVTQCRQRRGISPFVQHGAKGIDWDNQPLGEMTDSDLALELGVLRSTVSRARKSRGIQPAIAPSQKGIDWDNVHLGEKPDTVIALELGIQRRSVLKARRLRGIRAFSSSGYTYEGLPCKSCYEAMYDAYLHSEGIDHQHEVRVPETPYIADLLFPDGSYGEIVGMTGYKEYDDQWKKKVQAYSVIGITLRIITPSDVHKAYSKSRLEAIWK